MCSKTAAKVRLFFEPANIFQSFFRFLPVFVHLIDKHQPLQQINGYQRRFLGFAFTFTLGLVDAFVEATLGTLFPYSLAMRSARPILLSDCSIPRRISC